MQLHPVSTDKKIAAESSLLTYCTNIHAGESWTDIFASLKACVPDIRDQLNTPELGIGLRLGQAAVAELQEQKQMEQLKAFLGRDYSVFTINAFPYGPFHGEPVKENVYAPDWSTDERLLYTNQVASLLAELMATTKRGSDGASGDYGSISTVPGTFKPWAVGREEQIRHNLVQCASQLVQIERDTGIRLALALEPEPYCMLETIDETVSWFKDFGFSKESVRQLTQACGVNVAEADELLRRHLGVCYDVCHAAVEFEDVKGGFDTLEAAGITVPKIQLSSALRISSMNQETAEKLAAFDEPVYLHQVIQQSGASDASESLHRCLDLPEALQQLKNGKGEGAEWRIHFHVPVFIDKLEHFDTTQFFLREVLALLRERAISPHLEVETYTWDVLPEHLRSTDISTAIAREMQWVMDQLSVGPRPEIA